MVPLAVNVPTGTKRSALKVPSATTAPVTVNVPLDWAAMRDTLRPKGRLHVVGAVLEPIPVQAFPIIMGHNSISGSPNGAPVTSQLMLEFCARHNIAPQTEHFPMSKVNDAVQHLLDGKARYRIVLDMA